MQLKFVPRNSVKSTKKSTATYKPLYDALEQLQPDGETLRILYKDNKEFNAIRTKLYAYNKQNQVKLKISHDSEDKYLYVYL
jgi:RecA-family ATPase